MASDCQDRGGERQPRGPWTVGVRALSICASATRKSRVNINQFKKVPLSEGKEPCNSALVPMNINCSGDTIMCKPKLWGGKKGPYIMSKAAASQVTTLSDDNKPPPPPPCHTASLPTAIDCRGDYNV